MFRVYLFMSFRSSFSVIPFFAASVISGLFFVLSFLYSVGVSGIIWNPGGTSRVLSLCIGFPFSSLVISRMSMSLHRLKSPLAYEPISMAVALYGSFSAHCLAFLMDFSRSIFLFLMISMCFSPSLLDFWHV